MYGIISVLPFVFVFIGIFTVIYIIYTTINEKRRKKLRDKEFKKIKETLFSYEFESTQKMLSIKILTLKIICIQEIM